MEFKTQQNWICGRHLLFRAAVYFEVLLSSALSELLLLSAILQKSQQQTGGCLSVAESKYLQLSS